MSVCGSDWSIDIPSPTIPYPSAEYGFLLLKRLEGNDRFALEPTDAAIVTLSVGQLRWLLQGIDLAAVKKHPQRYFARV